MSHPSKVVSKYDLENTLALLERVAAKLRAEKWFDFNWQASVHYYPHAPAKPKSASMHVYKWNWFNENSQARIDSCLREAL